MAAGLLLDLKAIAEERGTVGEFAHRLQAIRERHMRKGRFIERLKPVGSIAGNSSKSQPAS
ncbi:MAG: hypothetical protein E5Y79_19050 [Mesorhizobium sp.]|uniref:hypothetical protein n=1 Tax=Mesorhizobium sp. TaxID=1871066 RepID=UPI00121A04A3|nr:hypothetical protein [Mesorhizobium sp.]TIL58608.1 MAG: hypothetical protein E5Y79_19050 [Mesorhizobium sp.]